MGCFVYIKCAKEKWKIRTYSALCLVKHQFCRRVNLWSINFKVISEWVKKGTKSLSSRFTTCWWWSWKATQPVCQQVIIENFHIICIYTHTHTHTRYYIFLPAVISAKEISYSCKRKQSLNDIRPLSKCARSLVLYLLKWR